MSAIPGRTYRIHKIGQVRIEAIEIASDLQCMNQVVAADADSSQVVESLCANSLVGPMVKYQRWLSRAAKPTRLVRLRAAPISPSCLGPKTRLDIRTVVLKADAPKSRFTELDPFPSASPKAAPLILKALPVHRCEFEFDWFDSMPNEPSSSGRSEPDRFRWAPVPKAGTSVRKLR